MFSGIIKDFGINMPEEREVVLMAKDKDIKKKEKKEHREKKSMTDARCCYVADPCGCYVDPCGCYVDPCCC
jgi:hypothetical protein